MKSRIFMYLFIFALLLIIFQLVNSKNILEDYETKLNRLEQREAIFKDSINNLEDIAFEMSSFNIDSNDDALSYFESLGYSTDKLIPVIKDELMELNNYDGDDHPIVPYVSMTENRMLIDQMRLLNHKWIVASFTDGKHKGEVFLTYEMDENQNLSFKLKEYFMYPVEQF